MDGGRDGGWEGWMDGWMDGWWPDRSIDRSKHLIISSCYQHPEDPSKPPPNFTQLLKLLHASGAWELSSAAGTKPMHRP